MKRLNAWALSAAALLALAVIAAPALAQEAQPESPAAAPPPRADDQTVETILRQQEELLSGQRFSYDPAGRRDPFRSLMETAILRAKGPRPRGVGGMLVAEIELNGIVRDPTGGDVALFIGSDKRGYFLRVGDEVYDGTVIAVDPRTGTVTFRQQVDDPRLIKPYRDVVKRLVPLEEEKANE